MSFRDLTTPDRVFRQWKLDLDARVRRLERGGTLRGTPSVAAFRIGDVMIEVDTSASPTLVLQASNLLTGSAPVVIATLP